MNFANFRPGPQHKVTDIRQQEEYRKPKTMVFMSVIYRSLTCIVTEFREWSGQKRRRTTR